MPTLLTPEETAERLRVRIKTVTNWLRSGVLPGIKIGHFWRIREDRLEAFLRDHEQTAG